MPGIPNKTGRSAYPNNAPLPRILFYISLDIVIFRALDSISFAESNRYYLQENSTIIHREGKVHYVPKQQWHLEVLLLAG